MNQSFVLYVPKGQERTKLSEKVAKQFGLPKIEYKTDTLSPVEQFGCLYILARDPFENWTEEQLEKGILDSIECRAGDDSIVDLPFYRLDDLVIH